MKLNNIVEDEYDGFEDSAEFSSPKELIAILKCEVFIHMTSQADKLSYQMMNRLSKIYGPVVFQRASFDVNEALEFVPSDEEIELVDDFSESDKIVHSWWATNRQYLLELIKFQKEYEELKDEWWPDHFDDYLNEDIYDDIPDESDQFGPGVPDELMSILKCICYLSTIYPPHEKEWWLKRLANHLDSIFKDSIGHAYRKLYGIDRTITQEDIEIIDGFSKEDKVIGDWWQKHRQDIVDNINITEDLNMINKDNNDFGEYDDINDEPDRFGLDHNLLTLTNYHRWLMIAGNNEGLAGYDSYYKMRQEFRSALCDVWDQPTCFAALKQAQEYLPSIEEIKHIILQYEPLKKWFIKNEKIVERLNKAIEDMTTQISKQLDENFGEYDDINDEPDRFGHYIPDELMAILKFIKHYHIIDYRTAGLRSIFGNYTVSLAHIELRELQDTNITREEIKLIDELCKNKLLSDWWDKYKPMINNIVEDEYDGFEDSAEFGSPKELIAILKCEVFINSAMTSQADKLSYQMMNRLSKIYGPVVLQRASWDVNKACWPTASEFIPSDEEIELVDDFSESDEIIHSWWATNRQYLLELIKFQKEHEEFEDEDEDEELDDDDDWN